MSGVTPVRPPQPSSSFGAVDQLTMPMTWPISDAPAPAKTGAPLSPVQAPSPTRWSRGGEIEQTDLQRAGFAGDAEPRHARNAQAARAPVGSGAEAGNGEHFAHGDLTRWR